MKHLYPIAFCNLLASAMPLTNWFPNFFSGATPLPPIHYFIHIPKCAGTSVISALTRLPKHKWAIVSDSPKSKAQANHDLLNSIGLPSTGQVSESKHNLANRLQVVMGHDVHLTMHQLPELKHRTPFYFTFLRDPIERYVSHYRYFVQCSANPNHPLHSFACQQVRPDDRLLTIDQYIEADPMPNLMTQYLGAANDPELESKRWQLDNQHLWNLAQDAVSKLDFIGFQDSIDVDLPKLLQRLNLRTKVTRTNVTQGSKPEIDPDTQRRIAKLNEMDLQLFEIAQAKTNNG